NGAAGSNALVSGMNGSATATGGGNSDSPALSGDGAFVAFRSDAHDLAANLGGPAGGNVFEYSRASGQSTLVSHAAAFATQTAQGSSTAPVISTSGRFVAFLSAATNLVAGQNNPTNPPPNNVYRWDQKTGASLLASGPVDGSGRQSFTTTQGPGAGRSPVLTGTGNVSFTTVAGSGTSASGSGYLTSLP